MADLWKMKAGRLIRFPVLFGAKVSSFLNTFPATPSVTLNSTPNRKLQERLVPFVAVYSCECVKVKSQSCVWRCVLGIIRNSKNEEQVVKCSFCSSLPHVLLFKSIRHLQINIYGYLRSLYNLLIYYFSKCI